MTKATIKYWFVAAMSFFAVLIAVGVVISCLDATANRVIFTTYKDLMPLAIAIAATWLGFCVQRRSAYLQHLRTIWSKLVDAVQSASQYTHLTTPEQKDYQQVLLKLSIAIDEIRGVFCNLQDEEAEGGLFPYEPIKDIHEIIASLKFGTDFQSLGTVSARKKIFVLWKEMRDELLKEFDREEPSWHHSHFKDQSRSQVYADHGIPKTET